MRILVIGDSMLDEYVYCDVTRKSPEAPVLIAKEERTEFKLGGAANVAYGLSKLNTEVSILSIVGDDEAGCKLNSLFDRIGIENLCIIDSTRKTTIKKRFLDLSNQHLLRVDSENDHLINTNVQKIIIANLTEQISSFNAIILADYDKGIFGEYLVDIIANVNIPVFADLKPTQLGIFKNLEAITPNLQEAISATNGIITQNDYEAIARMAKMLAQRAKNVLITLGSQGIYFYNDEISQHILAVNNVVRDTCGCGDVVTLIYAYAFLEGNDALSSAIIANKAAAMTTEKIGVANIDIIEYENIKMSVVGK